MKFPCYVLHLHKMGGCMIIAECQRRNGEALLAELIFPAECGVYW